MKETNYTVVEGEGMMMLTYLIEKVKARQKEGWVCRGGVFVDTRVAYQAMVKEAPTRSNVCSCNNDKAHS